jgi:S1-C subfamily serine protease
VVDRLGATVWNAEVAAGEPPDWRRAVRTDHAGHFSLGSLTPGEHVVTARHDGQTAVSAQAVRIYTGQDSPGLVLRFPDVVDDTKEADSQSRARRTAPETKLAKMSAEAALGFAAHDDVVVVERVAGSAAAESGLLPGDVLVRVDGEAVRSAAQARGMLAAGRARGRIMEVRRAGKLERLQYGAPH